MSLLNRADGLEREMRMSLVTREVAMLAVLGCGHDRMVAVQTSEEPVFDTRNPLSRHGRLETDLWDAGHIRDQGSL